MGRQDSGVTPPGVRVAASMQKFVRVTGARLGKYVEFEFSVNDADLTVELILPFAAFDEFCRLQNATVLPSDPSTAAHLEQLAWRSRQPGLLAPRQDRRRGRAGRRRTRLRPRPIRAANSVIPGREIDERSNQDDRTTSRSARRSAMSRAASAPTSPPRAIWRRRSTFRRRRISITSRYGSRSSGITTRARPRS